MRSSGFGFSEMRRRSRGPYTNGHCRQPITKPNGHRWRSTITVLLVGALTIWLFQPGIAQQPGTPAPEVRTAQGILVGKRFRSGFAFQGIPYAAAPVGVLRFRSPQPHAPWSMPRSAMEYGSVCPQLSANGFKGNEDCLFLNVFAPADAIGNGSAGRSVMVWIHGGGYGAGAGSDRLYDPSVTVEKTGTVVVTLNYRLGALGFLAYPALSDEDVDGRSGNYGIEDQQAALAWVQRNIAAFGGDPNNVTIFGESAGGNSVLINLASPTAAGLFRRAIAESPLYGSSLLTSSEAAALWGNEVSKVLNCPLSGPEGATCLRAAPLQELVAFSQISVKHPFGLFAPVIDGVMLKQSLYTTFRAGAFNQVPVMIGSNHDEGTLMTSVLYNLNTGPVTAAQYPELLAEHFGDNAVSIALSYPLTDYPTPSQALAAVFTDSFFACPTERARTAISHHVLTFGYEFVVPNPVAPQGYPATAPGIEMLDAHTFELPYVFGHNGTDPLPDERAMSLSQTMIGYWTNFAARDEPNQADPGSQAPTALPPWPNFTARTRPLLALTDGPKVTTAFRSAHRCGLWDRMNPEGLY
jgi:para-nitrobenzyl esterase